MKTQQAQWWCAYPFARVGGEHFQQSPPDAPILCTTPNPPVNMQVASTPCNGIKKPFPGRAPSLMGLGFRV